jgi:hypothetical protein
MVSNQGVYSQTFPKYVLKNVLSVVRENFIRNFFLGFSENNE